MLRWARRTGATATAVLLLMGGCSLFNEYEDVPVDTGAGAGAASCALAQDCDDDNDCTDDACNDLICSSEQVADGASCNVDGQPGACTGGECVVSCTADDQSGCDDAEPCTIDSCNFQLGSCEHEALDNEMPPGTADAAGDCALTICSMGVAATTIDLQDVPIDGLDCTRDECSANGTPSNPPEPVDEPCGANGTLLCDGAGNCTGCNSNNDCGIDTQCRQHVCNSGVCSVVNANGPCDDGIFCNGPDSCDTSGNCSVHAGDPCPGPDGDNDCSEVCDESASACTGNDPQGSNCDDGQFCNGNDACANGLCSDHAGDPCPGPNLNYNCKESCDETNNNCMKNDPDGSRCGDEDTCCYSGSCTECN